MEDPSTVRRAPRCCCRLPFPVPLRDVDADVEGPRLRAIRLTEKLLLNGSKITYAFVSPEGGRRDVVRRAFKTWEAVGLGVRFHEVKNVRKAQVRIAFDETDGNWSHVGRDIFNIPDDEPTMNLQNDDHLDTCLHEIGHTLGFKHEHQNPKGGIVWDVEAVYAHFASAHAWTEKDVDHNILNKLPLHKVDGSAFDPDSVMCYDLPAGLILQPERYQHEALVPAGGLSATDKYEARRAYPPIIASKARKEFLAPFKIVRFETRRGGQVTLAVKPGETDVFVIRTMGKSDTLIVLFEEDAEGELEFVAGDDDSGKRKNAKIRVRLQKEKRYLLKIRLFFEGTKGKTAVAMSHAKASASDQ